MELFAGTNDPIGRMTTMASLLHHKMRGFSWTGFYLLRNAASLAEPELLVGPYQGALACLKPPAHTGVCWAGIDRREPMLLPNVYAFPRQMAGDPRSPSEVVVSLRDAAGSIVGVLDVDSTTPANFDQLDTEELSKLVALVYA
ncbi:MAG: GAF domain-containing protein [Thermoanaerobaculaceae bacterium]